MEYLKNNAAATNKSINIANNKSSGLCHKSLQLNPQI